MSTVGRITLIGTKHNEVGNCNVEALHGLLEILSPEVIFEELRSEDMAACYADPTLQSLEMQAVSRYVQGRIVRQVPVDAFELPPGFANDSDRLFDYVIARSPEYRSLQRVADEETNQFGFAYLNSPPWSALSQRMQAVMEDTIAQSGDAALEQIITTWNTLVRKREVAMVDNIYAFARENSFTGGVFLVGAAHRSAIADIIAARSVVDQGLIAWDFGSRP